MRPAGPGRGPRDISSSIHLPILADMLAALDRPPGSRDHLSTPIMQAEIALNPCVADVVPALIADLGDEAAWRYAQSLYLFGTRRLPK